MESLKHCKSLVLVDIGDTNVTERGVKCLSECKALEVLALWGTEVTDRIADVLSEFVPLYVLNLTDTKISVDAINEIATMFPETYIFNRTYGDRFRGLIGREAMHAWMQDDDQNDAFKPDLRGFPDG